MTGQNSWQLGNQYRIKQFRCWAILEHTRGNKIDSRIWIIWYFAVHLSLLEIKNIYILEGLQATKSHVDTYLPNRSHWANFFRYFIIHRLGYTHISNIHENKNEKIQEHTYSSSARLPFHYLWRIIMSTGYCYVRHALCRCWCCLPNV